MLQVATPSKRNFKVHPCKALQTASSNPGLQTLLTKYSFKLPNLEPFWTPKLKLRVRFKLSSSFLQSRNDTPPSFLQLFFNLSLKPFLPSSKDLPSTSPPLCFLQASGGGVEAGRQGSKASIFQILKCYNSLNISQSPLPMLLLLLLLLLQMSIEILEISIEIGCLLMEISIKHLKISIEI